MTLSSRLTIPQYSLVEWKVLSRNEEYVTGIVKGLVLFLFIILEVWFANCRPSHVSTDVGL